METINSYKNWLREVENLIKKKYSEFYGDEDLDQIKEPEDLYRIMNDKGYDSPSSAYNSDNPKFNNKDLIEGELYANFETYLCCTENSDDENNDDDYNEMCSLIDALNLFITSKDFMDAYIKLNKGKYLNIEEFKAAFDFKINIESPKITESDLFTSLLLDVITKSDHSACFILSEFEYSFYIYIIAEIDGKVLDIIIDGDEEEGTIDITISYK